MINCKVVLSFIKIQFLLFSVSGINYKYEIKCGLSEYWILLLMKGIFFKIIRFDVLEKVMLILYDV